MLAIRMQRTGRSGHTQFRLIVQDKRFSPTSGRVVAFIGNYDPHTKVAKVDAEKVVAYLKNGAQPTDRVAMILKKEGVKLPTWFKPSAPQKRAIKSQDKLRRNRPKDAEPVEAPAGAPEPVKEEAPAVEPASGEPVESADQEAVTDAAAPENETENTTVANEAESPAAETIETPSEEAAAKEAPKEVAETVTTEDPNAAEPSESLAETVESVDSTGPATEPETKPEV